MCDCAEYQQGLNTGRKIRTDKTITRREMSTVDTSTKLFTAILNQRGLVHMSSHKCHRCNASRHEHLGTEACWGSTIGTQDLSSRSPTQTHACFILWGFPTCTFAERLLEAADVNHIKNCQLLIVTLISSSIGHLKASFLMKSYGQPMASEQLGWV